MKRAILVSGGIDVSASFERYRNDLVAFRSALTAYGFSSEDVRIHFEGGGTFDFDGDGQAESYRPATRDEVLAGLRWLAEAEDGFAADDPPSGAILTCGPQWRTLLDTV